MAAIEILRLPPDATLEELVKQVNRLTDLVLGNDGARMRLTGHDGVERDLQTGAAVTSGNYQVLIKSAGPNHLQVQHSSGSPDVLRVQDAGLTVAGALAATGTTTLTGPLAVTGATTLTGDLAVTGNAVLGDNAAADTLTVNAIETHNGPATFAGAATVNGAAAFKGNVALGDAAADLVTVAGTMTLPAINPPTAAGQLTQGAVCGGWAYVTYAAGVPTLRAGYNVASITDDGVGLLTIVWDRDFASANYAVVPMVGSGGIGGVMPTVNAQSAGTTQIGVYGHAGALGDPASVAVIAFGLLL